MKVVKIKSCAECPYYQTFNWEGTFSYKRESRIKIIGVCTHPELKTKRTPTLEITSVNGKLPEYVPSFCPLEDA